MRLSWFWGLLSLGLVACGPRHDLAPVSELVWHRHLARPALHRVLPGETLYAIAFQYDLDYQTLAAYNHLSHPYALKAGQKIQLGASSTQALTATRVVNTDAHQPVHPYRIGDHHVVFAWPMHGRVLHTFSPTRARKGIDIVGLSQAAVHAAAPGVVAYAGNGLLGYGNLIIIKHQRRYLTAYGHLGRMMVKEGQVVRSGQTVGVVGRVEHQYWGVHFEIRQGGMPMNPLIYLKNR